MGSGRTKHGVWHNQIIDLHPDTGAPLGGLEIPGWDRLLELAAGCFELTGLGYLGVDFVLDRDRGPLMLELNARPGLAIQLANGIGLGHRIAMIDAAIGRDGKPTASPAERAAFAQASFGAEAARHSTL
jgi:hypothetical protein